MKYFNILNFQNLHKFILETKHYYEVYYDTSHSIFSIPDINNNFGRSTLMLSSNEIIEWITRKFAG